MIIYPSKWNMRDHARILKKRLSPFWNGTVQY